MKTELIDLFAQRLTNSSSFVRSKILLQQFELELKSINSERSNEAQAVRQNEHTQEVCSECEEGEIVVTSAFCNNCGTSY